MEKKLSVCAVCGTVLVPAKGTVSLDGSLPMDGSTNLNGEICPKCHPELVNAE